MSNLDAPCIYRIVHVASGKTYIGSALNRRKRLYEHRRTLEKGQHKNPILQAAWTKHGADAFRFEVIEDCSPDDAALLAAEQRQIDAHRAVGVELYNVCPVAGTRRGAKMPASAVTRISELKRGNTYRLGKGHGPETREKIAAALRGRSLPPEVREKVAAAHRGKKRSEEARRRMSEAQKGKVIPQEMRDRIAAKLRGRSLPPGVREKVRAAHTRRREAGIKYRPCSPEVIAARAARRRGLKQKPESVAKRAAALRGKKRTPEQRAAIAQRMREVWADGRRKRPLKVTEPAVQLSLDLEEVSHEFCHPTREDRRREAAADRQGGSGGS